MTIFVYIKKKTKSNYNWILAKRLKSNLVNFNGLCYMSLTTHRHLIIIIFLVFKFSLFKFTACNYFHNISYITIKICALKHVFNLKSKIITMF